MTAPRIDPKPLASGPKSPPAAALVPAGKSEMENRLMAIYEVMVNGVAGQDLLAIIQERWGLSRRSAQVYVQKVRRRMARTAEKDHPSAVQQLSQVQRSRLLERILLAIRGLDLTDPSAFRNLVALSGAAERLIGAREQSARRAGCLAVTSVAVSEEQFTQALTLPVVRPGCAAQDQGEAAALENGILPKLLENQELGPGGTCPAPASEAPSAALACAPLRDAQPL
jgi:hypothetical protein